MKKQQIFQLGFLGAALAAWAVCVPTASASVIGHLSVTNCQGGGVTVGGAIINWLPSAGSNDGCLQVGIGTNITSLGDGTLTTASSNGIIRNLPAGETGFMSFTTGVNFLFDLTPVTGFGPGIATGCASNPTIGASCSVELAPGVFSPFILTYLGGTRTAVTLLAHGTILDLGDGSTSIWNGAFTTQLNSLDPATIQTTILSGGIIQSSYSGEFDITAEVPEPVSLSLLGGGLIALGILRRRRLA